MRRPTSASRVLAAAAAAVALAGAAAPGAQERPTGQGFSFRTGVELVNVTVTVTDANGRFVPNLTKDDFILYEDGVPQPIAQFEAERVPVSLGIALDTSGSMLGEKMAAARAALNRFLFDLLGPQDEIFLARFDSRPSLVHGWTSDRQVLVDRLGAIQPRGGTAMFDTIAEAVPLAQRGGRRKKALVVISDGNDTSSQTRIDDLVHLIRETEVLVYAVGIDAGGEPPPAARAASGSSARQPVPSPFPGRPPAAQPPPPPQPPPSAPPASRRMPGGGTADRVNAQVLRDITDPSGGRTEIIYSHRDLDPATAGIADELSRQYFLGYVSAAPKDGRWHTIEVRLRRGAYTVRARKGFVAG